MMFGKKKRYLYMSNEEHRIAVQSLAKLENTPIQQDRNTNCVDELIVKCLEAPCQKNSCKPILVLHRLGGQCAPQGALFWLQPFLQDAIIT